MREIESRRGDKKVIEDEMRKFREEQRKQLDTLLAEYQGVRDAMGESRSRRCNLTRLFNLITHRLHRRLHVQYREQARSERRCLISSVQPEVTILHPI